MRPRETRDILVDCVDYVDSYDIIEMVDMGHAAVIYWDCDPGRTQMPIAKYERVANTIREQIRSGELKPGERLPSTKELQDIHDVSYGTLRTALLLLKAEKLIEGQPGEGVYVTKSSS